MSARIRYNIIARTRKASGFQSEAILNFQPLRPGSVEDALFDACLQQANHYSYHGKIEGWRGAYVHHPDGSLAGMFMFRKTRDGAEIVTVGVRVA